MALDGILLKQIIVDIDAYMPLRINRIAQISKNEIIFECFNQSKINLLFCTDSATNRLQITHQKYVKDSQPSHFIMLLRKYCENGIIQSIQQHQLDRIVTLTITNRDDLGDIQTYFLVMELLGKYANIILLNDHMTIIDGFIRIAPYTNANRIIFSGATYHYPTQLNKKNPFNAQAIDDQASLVNQFEGFSPLLAREIEYRMTILDQSFKQIIQQCQRSNKLYCYQNQFHIIELYHLGQTASIYPLMEGLDQLYQSYSHQQRMKQQSGDLVKTIKKELKRLHQKLPKLQAQLNDALQYDEYRHIGDVLLTYGQHIPNGLSKTTLSNFDGNKITIYLDSRYNGIDNAKKYYQKYQKLKKGETHLKQQIELTQQEIIYLEGIDHQLKEASFDDIAEIEQELYDHRLIRKLKTSKKSKQKQKVKLNQIEYQGHIFYYGKSNFQNDLLTFKFASKKDTWFHVQQGSGTHVLVQIPLEKMSEDLIRFGANLAALHSRHYLSSSVAVNYTSVQFIKKIPKAPLGMVSLNQYQTIYIDPDKSLLSE